MAARFDGIDDALAWLAGHVDYERTAPTRRDVPTLDPVREALRALGDPQLDVPFVHVTGTNGKGSTAAIASALLRAAGRRVGTYTSPDLHALNERIAVAGTSVDDATLTSLLERLRVVESTLDAPLTRFDLLTVGALLHFSDEGVDAGVVEVGLGGTWDSTNAIDGVVAVVTNVSLDHTEVLGDTVEAIATDKAGIIKPGSTAVLGDTEASTIELQSRLARASGATAVWRRGHELALARNDLAVGGRLVTLSTPHGEHADVFVGLHGAHQGANALCALAAAEAFEDAHLGELVVADALRDVRVPGRLEVMSRRPTIVLDGAHNPAGATVLADALVEAFAVDGVTRCVIGMMSNRDPLQLLGPLAAAGVQVVYACRADTPRALPAATIADAARGLGLDARVVDAVPDAIDAAQSDASGDDLVVVTGSLYVVGDARGHLLGLGAHRG